MLTLHILGIWRERRERKVWRPWSFLDHLGKPSSSTVLAIPYSALLSVSTAISKLRCWLSPTPPNLLLYTRCWNMCLLCIPCKFTLFQAEFKWRLGNCMMTIKYCVGCRKITGKQHWAYLDLPKSTSLHLLEEILLRMAEGDPAFCCSKEWAREGVLLSYPDITMLVLSHRRIFSLLVMKTKQWEKLDDWITYLQEEQLWISTSRLC